MDIPISRRPIAAMISLAAAVILLVVTAAKPATPLPTLPTPRVVTQAVALTANPLAQIWDVVTGVDTSHPLPAGSNPIAPITEQVLRSVATYSGQLLSGQGHLIPGEISAQVNKLQDALPTVQGLLADSIAVIPAVAFSAFFITVALIGSLPTSASAVPGLAEIWLRAVFLPPLKWVYNGFAIRNAIATALQPPSSQPESSPRRVPSARAITTKKVAASPTKRTKAPTSKRSGKPGKPTTGVAGPQRQRQAAP